MAGQAGKRGRKLCLGHGFHAGEDSLDGGLVEGDGLAVGVAPVQLDDDAAPRNGDAFGAVEGGELVVVARHDRESAGPAAIEAFAGVGLNDQARSSVGAAGWGGVKAWADLVARGGGGPAVEAVGD